MDGGCPRAWTGAVSWRNTKRFGRDLDRPARVPAARHQSPRRGFRAGATRPLNDATPPKHSASCVRPEGSLACSRPP